MVNMKGLGRLAIAALAQVPDKGIQISKGKVKACQILEPTAKR
jgi:hypothetical protein